MQTKPPYEAILLLTLSGVVTVVALACFIRFIMFQNAVSKSVNLMNLCIQNSSQGKQIDAIRYGIASRDAYPTGFWGHLYLGIAYSKNGDHLKAVPELQSANRITETNEANYYLAASLLALRRVKEAEPYLQKAEDGNDAQLSDKAKYLRTYYLHN